MEFVAGLCDNRNESVANDMVDHAHQRALEKRDRIRAFHDRHGQLRTTEEVRRSHECPRDTMTAQDIQRRARGCSLHDPPSDQPTDRPIKRAIDRLI